MLPVHHFSWGCKVCVHGRFKRLKLSFGVCFSISALCYFMLHAAGFVLPASRAACRQAHTRVRQTGARATAPTIDPKSSSTLTQPTVTLSFDAAASNTLGARGRLGPEGRAFKPLGLRASGRLAMA